MADTSGKKGYTIKLFDLVLAHKQSSDIPPVERIVNYVGWPQTVSAKQRADRRWQAVFMRTPMPDGIADLAPETFIREPNFFKPDSPPRRFAWARGLTLMRETQTADMYARIVLGGKVGPSEIEAPDGSRCVAWYNGRIPGVLEEILLTILARKPIYLCGAFGGAAALAVDLLQGCVPINFSWEFHKQAPYAQEMLDLYAKRGDSWLDYADMSKIFATIGIAGLAANNGLTEAENFELFACRDVSRILELILTGLTRS